MKHIFYLIAIVFIIQEILWILYPNEQVLKNIRYKRLAKTNKNKKWDDHSQEYKDLLKFTMFPRFITVIWLFLGLFTFNWFSFLVIIVFNFIIIAPLSKLVEFNILYTILHWFNSIIGFAFGIIVILNSYHFKIDVYQLFLSLIQ